MNISKKVYFDEEFIIIFTAVNLKKKDNITLQEIHDYINTHFNKDSILGIEYENENDNENKNAGNENTKNENAENKYIDIIKKDKDIYFNIKDTAQINKLLSTLSMDILQFIIN